MRKAALMDAAGRILPGQLLGALAQGGTSEVSGASAILGAVIWAAGLGIAACLAFSRGDVVS